MIFALLGQTNSGKSTIIKELIGQGYETVVSYTTRPKRKNEIEGKDYFFISNDIFDAADKEKLIILKNSFVAHNGEVWKYGKSRHAVNTAIDPLLIVEPNGLGELLKDFGRDHVVSIYLNINEQTRLRRGLNRKDNVNELYRRVMSDLKDFKGIENLVDHVITSEEKDESINEIKKIIGEYQ